MNMEKMSFGQIKKDLKNNKEFKEYFEEEGKIEALKFQIDSLKNGEFLVNPVHEWKIYDSSLKKFAETFSSVLPDSYTDIIEEPGFVKPQEYANAFKKYIENTLRKNRHRSAIEFGGSGSKLFSEFSKGYFEKTLGVSLEDIRTDKEKRIDSENNHNIFVGDILNTKDTNFDHYLHDDLKIEKVDLIISRMMGPLDGLAKNPLLLERVIQKWYQLLNQNGIIFLQFEFFDKHLPTNHHDAFLDVEFNNTLVPEDFTETEKIVQEWVQAMQKQFPKEIEFQLDRGTLRIHKKPGAPDELPLFKDLQKDSQE